MRKVGLHPTRASLRLCPSHQALVASHFDALRDYDAPIGSPLELDDLVDAR